MIVVDKNLWHDSCFWGWFSRFFIPVDRGSDKLQISVIRQIKTALETGKGVLIFLEGGRTCRAKEGEKLQQSAKGKKMRFLHSTAEGIARITGAPVIPLWIQGTDDMLPNSEDPKVYLTKLLPWKRIQVVVGEPLFYQKLKAEGKLGSSGMFTQILSAELLALADEIP